MMYPIKNRIVFLVLLLSRCIYGAWKENQAGEVESVWFESLVRQNSEFSKISTSEECNSTFGWEFWTSLKKSKRSLCESIVQYEYKDYRMLIIENASLSSVEFRTEEWKTPFVDAHIQMDLVCKSAELRKYTPFLRGARNASPKCETWIEDPLVILPWFDTANWWHFLEQGVMPGFTYFGVAQRDLLESGRNPQIATLRWPAERKWNTRDQGVYPTWVALPEVLEKMIGPIRVVPLDPFKTSECFRTILWTSHAPTHLAIDRLGAHTYADCYSPILRSAADLVRSVMGAAAIRSARRKIVYVKRGGSEWTPHQRSRTVRNQDEIIQYLKDKARAMGYEFEALEFYYENMKTAKEQILRVSMAQVMVGVHGAGLATMIALPPESTIIELRVSVVDTHFQRLASLLGHRYYGVAYHRLHLPSNELDYIWDAIK
jgi:hypothetical protein